ncbi:MAG: hypothetical protein V1871_06610 [Planctomycetota bacterium]
MARIEDLQNKVKVLKTKTQDKKQDNIKALRKSLKRTQRKMRLLIAKKASAPKKKDKNEKQSEQTPAPAAQPPENKKS